MQRIDIFNLLVSTAEPLYGAREAEQIARMILNEVAGVTMTQYIIDPRVECQIENLDLIIDDLAAGRPVQYIVGECDFCDLRLKIREGALIPRPETEELVDLIVRNSSSNSRILDVGCGSGAISIALAKALPRAQVWALETSDEAIAIARENSDKLDAGINFVEGDALEGVEYYVDGEFDVIVSNPPYIPQSEQCTMRTNVLEYEPHLALFVDDDSPLIFYQAISRSAQLLLRNGGRLYFEIHEFFGQEIVDMLENMNYCEVELVRDINNKERMICATKR